MAISRQQLLIGVGLLATSAATWMYLTIPMFGDIQASFKKSNELKTTVERLDLEVERTSSQIAKLRKLKTLPGNLTVRTFAADAFQQHVKAMLDQVIRLSTESGNDLISLEPWDAPNPKVSNEATDSGKKQKR